MYPPNNRRPFADPFELFPSGLTKMYSTWLSLTYPFASIGRNVSFHFTSKVSRQRSPRISLGNSVRLLEYAWLNVATDDPTGEPTIVIDDNCSIGYGSIVSGKNRVHLGARCTCRSACRNSRSQSRVRRYRRADHQARYYEGWQNPNWRRIVDRSWGGHPMLTRRADNRPPLCCFSQLGGDAKHSRLLRSFWNAGNHN